MPKSAHVHTPRSTIYLTHDSKTLELTFQLLLITNVFKKYGQSPAWLNINEVQQGNPQIPQVTNSANANRVESFIGQ